MNAMSRVMLAMLVAAASAGGSVPSPMDAEPLVREPRPRFIPQPRPLRVSSPPRPPTPRVPLVDPRTAEPLSLHEQLVYDARKGRAARRDKERERKKQQKQARRANRRG